MITSEVIIAIIALLGTLLSPMFTEWAKTVFGKKKKDPVGQAIDLAGKIQEKLDRIRSKIGADKAHIIQFHNGGTFYPTGKSIAKFSIIYESLALGQSAIQLMYQGVPVAAFYKLIEGVKKDRFIEIYDINNPLIPDTYDLLASAQLHGWKSYYAFGMFDFDDRMIGICIFNFHNQPKQLTDLETNTVLSEAGVIGGVLMTHLNS